MSSTLDLPKSLCNQWDQHLMILRKSMALSDSRVYGYVFEGSMDLADIELWFMMKKYFKVMRCPEERKDNLATFLLKKEAKRR